MNQLPFWVYIVVNQTPMRSRPHQTLTSPQVTGDTAKWSEYMIHRLVTAMVDQRESFSISKTMTDVSEIYFNLKPIQSMQAWIMVDTKWRNDKLVSVFTGFDISFLFYKYKRLPWEYSYSDRTELDILSEDQLTAGILCW